MQQPRFSVDHTYSVDSDIAKYFNMKNQFKDDLDLISKERAEAALHKQNSRQTDNRKTGHL